MKVSTAQLERVVLLLTIGLAVAIQRRKVSTEVANQVLFSPLTMSLLRAAGVRAPVVHLVHVGTEIEDIESIFPHKLDSALHTLIEDAIACLESCEPYDFNSDMWIAQLLGAARRKH